MTDIDEELARLERIGKVDTSHIKARFDTLTARAEAAEARLAWLHTPEAADAVAATLDEHNVAERRSDLTQVCDCGFDFDPCHWGNPWPAHLAAAALRALTARTDEETDRG